MSTRRSLRSRDSAGQRAPSPASTDARPASTARPPRITPRNSAANQALLEATEETPYETLRQLSRIIGPATPRRRASSAGPPSSLRTRTPLTQIRTPGGAALRQASARRLNPSTPHGRAALREIESRRAALFTPGDRRRSVRQQRETPRDLLRELSRVLAAGTEVVESSPREIQEKNESTQRLARLLAEEADAAELPDLPSLSVPIGELEDDDSIILDAPHSAALDEDNATLQSVEFARRAISEQPARRLSRGSFGSVRMSDRFADLKELGFEDLPEDPTVQRLDDDMEQVELDAPSDVDDLPPIIDDSGRISLTSRRSSDIRPRNLVQDDTTFVFAVPQRSGIPRGRVQPASATPEPKPPRNESADAEKEDTDEEDEAEDEQEEDAEVDMDDEPDEEMEQLYDPTITLRTSTIDHSKDATQSELTGSLSTPGRRGRPASNKSIRVSKHGIPCPSLPAGVVKRLANTFSKAGGSSKIKINAEMMTALMQATDWYFEQVSDDLGAYANHARRKTIEDVDVITLMRRQRFTNSTTTPFSLAQKYLPRELLQELRMQPTTRRKTRLEAIEEEEE